MVTFHGGMQSSDSHIIQLWPSAELFERPSWTTLTHSLQRQNDDSVELHLALLCLLAEDFLNFLDLPARYAQDFWDLEHTEPANPGS